MKHKDRWDLPKGHVDPGESDLEAAFRELVEETGIKQADVAHDAKFIFEHQYEVTGKRYNETQDNDKVLKTLLIYLGYVESEVEIELTEHLGYQWFDWNPPHQIQQQTIDPLLGRVAKYLQQ